jgi:glycosyltransferase involved in cell wall biosynthesis
MKKVALYNPYLSTKGGGEKVCLALADSLQHTLGCSVYLVSHGEVDLDDLASYFKLDLSGIQVVQIDYDSLFYKILARVPLPGRLRNIFLDHRVLKTLKSKDFDIFINNCYQSNLPSPIKRGVYMCMFPQRLQGTQPNASPIKKLYVGLATRLSRMVLHPGYKNPIDTYQVITANSAYTQGFITSRWHKDSDILYPICENMHEDGIAKEKIILSVGRFFANDGESHHKRHDALLATFARMKDLHEKGWQLHLAGSVAEDVGALKYILQLMKSAQDLPVYFHFNSSFKELHRLFNQATIYWHATGYGSDPDLHPEKQEHFGITTVEAMSTGAIPIVINSAGQKESVINGVNGYLWDSLDQLAEETGSVVALATKPRTQLSGKAIEGSRQYDKAAFQQNVAEIFEPIINA